MKKLLFLVCIIFGQVGNASDRQIEFCFDVISKNKCITDLRVDQRDQDSQRQRQQTVQKFIEDDCEIALNVCQDQRRQYQQQNPRQVGQVDCHIAKKPELGNPEPPRSCRDISIPPKIPHDPGQVDRRGRCNRCGHQDPCERIRCGRNPFNSAMRNGGFRRGSMQRYANYQKCQRKKIACEEKVNPDEIDWEAYYKN